MTVPLVPSSPPGNQTFMAHRGRRLERRSKSTDCKPTASFDRNLDATRLLSQIVVEKPISPTSPTSPSLRPHFQRKRPTPCEVARAPPARARSQSSRRDSSCATPMAGESRLSPVMQAAGRVMANGRPKPADLTLGCPEWISQDAPTTSANSSDSGTPTPPALGSLRRKRSLRPGTISSNEESERCGCCTKEDFWSLFDTFQDMDRDQSGVIGRRDFVWALRTLGACVDFNKAANKAKLAAHFQKTARDLNLEGFIRRAFPTSSDADITRMMRWANLRRAHNMLLSDKFKATESELCQVYSFLLEDGNTMVPLREVIRAKILSREEANVALPSQWGCAPIDFEAFCGLILRKYWNMDEAAPAEGMGPPSPNSVWRSAVRYKFLQTRDALVEEIVCEESKDGSSLSWQPIVMPMLREGKDQQLRSPSRRISAVEASQLALNAQHGATESTVLMPVPPAGSPSCRPRRSGPVACNATKDSAEGFNGRSS